MKFATISGVTIAYRMRGKAGAPAIALVNALGTDARIWDDVVDRLSPRFRVLTYDLRGQGLSDAPDGPYSLGDHIRDLIGLTDVCQINAFAVVGLSVGGLIAQGLAGRLGNRLQGLVLCNTAARIGTTEFWDDRIAIVSGGGTIAIADTIMERWFGPTFLSDRPVDVAGWRNMLIAVHGAGYCATCATLRDTDLTEITPMISVPALVLAAEHDRSTPPELVQATAALIPGASFEVIRDAGHLSPIEQPALLAELIEEFLKDIGHG